MSGEQLLEQMEYIDSGLIESATEPRKKVVGRRRLVIRAACIAAVCLISGVGISSVLRSSLPESITGAGSSLETNSCAEGILLKIDGRIVRYEYDGSERVGADFAGEELVGTENDYQQGGEYRVYKLKGHEDCAQLLLFREGESTRIDGGEDWSLWDYAGIEVPETHTIAETLSYFGIDSPADIQKVKTSWWVSTDEYQVSDFPIREYRDRETIQRFYRILVSAARVDRGEYYALNDTGETDVPPTDDFFSDATNLWKIDLYTREGSVFEYRMNRTEQCLDTFYGNDYFLISPADWDWMSARCGFGERKESE